MWLYLALVALGIVVGLVARALVEELRRRAPRPRRRRAQPRWGDRWGGQVDPAELERMARDEIGPFEEGKK